VQIADFEIDGLFHSFRHKVPLETRPDESQAEATVTIIHGPNGVGKTTMLHMLDGIMGLDFTVFRRIPFSKGTLRFSTGQRLVVRAERPGSKGALLVSFGGREVKLHAAHGGPADEQDEDEVEAFRKEFFEFTTDISFDLVGATRHSDETPWWRREGQELDGGIEEILTPSGERRFVQTGRRRRRPGKVGLAERVERFIADAQVDYRKFFSSSEPELFPRIMARLSEGDAPSYDLRDLRERLTSLREAATESEELGLEVEPWSYEDLVPFLSQANDGEAADHALMVLGTYAEFLESAAEKRQLLASRLRTFEGILDDFYTGKRVRANAKGGLRIETLNGDSLTEQQLSSGEYHLLYLMVTALVSKRRGAVIAIDEPEMSMHIAWQRKLIPNLVACASHASPQLLFATHSPEVVADFRSHLVELEAKV
jgi:predicted ATPase